MEGAARQSPLIIAVGNFSVMAFGASDIASCPPVVDDMFKREPFWMNALTPPG